MHLFEQPAHRLHKMLAAKEITAVELCDSVFSRIGVVEDRVKSYITLTEERARAKAEVVDAKIAAGKELAPLAGIPIAIKDVICTKDVETTCGSRILKGHIPVYNASVIDRLERDDYVMTGKANMDEFAMGSSTENSGFHVTANPWSLELVPGGSSGGSAACVAAGEAIASLGSDTGGSIRQPAALCGMVGLKPTYGRVSRYGLVAFASSLDQIGPVTRDVTDSALILQAISGHDAKDSTSAPREVPDFLAYVAKDEPSLNGIRVGVVKELISEGLETGVKEVFDAAVDRLSKLGAELEEVSLPNVDYALSPYYVIAPAEASSNLARYDGVRFGFRDDEAEDIFNMYGKTRGHGFGDEVKRRIMIGTYALSSGYYQAYYDQAQRVRTLVVQDFEKAFEKFDLLISPTSPTVAFKIGAKAADPLQMYLSDICTIPVNLAGIPAISVPCGLADGLPVGLHIMAPPFEEGRLLSLAHAFEKSLALDARPEL